MPSSTFLRYVDIVCIHGYLLSAIYHIQCVEEAMQRNKDNTHPWILCVGSPGKISSAVLVCQRKVITNEIGKSVFSSLLVLMTVHYTYEFSYNPLTQ